MARKTEKDPMSRYARDMRDLFEYEHTLRPDHMSGMNLHHFVVTVAGHRLEYYHKQDRVLAALSAGPRDFKDEGVRREDMFIEATAREVLYLELSRAMQIREDWTLRPAWAAARLSWPVLRAAVVAKFKRDSKAWLNRSIAAVLGVSK